MDKEALKHLQGLHGAAETEISIGPAQRGPLRLVPSGFRVEDMELYLKQPTQMRQRFETSLIHAFCAYVVEQYQHEETAVFIHPNGKGARAVLDYGSHTSPMWGCHKAALNLEYTSEYAELKSVAHPLESRPLSQRDFAEWIEDWHHLLSFHTEGEQGFSGDYQSLDSISLGDALRRVRNLDLKAQESREHQAAQWSSKQSAFESIEANSKEGVLPSILKFRAAVFEELQPVDIYVRVSMLTNDDKPRFRLRIMGFERVKQQARDAVQDLIQLGLPDHARIFIGINE